eukprot:m.290789 g.290789  ORF g.290789 m.290789 type:complete len:452 (+) comp12362_c0_seq1:32-1387(+)
MATTRTPRPPARRSASDLYADRFIPSRKRRHLNPAAAEFKCPESDLEADDCTDRDPGRLAFDLLLQNEVLDAQIPAIAEQFSSTVTRRESCENLFSFKPPRAGHEPPSAFSLSPVSNDSERLLLSPRRMARKISSIPIKVLDAPDLQDDFYLNLVDWSAQNILSVGLGHRVYLYSAYTSQVSALATLCCPVTAVEWSPRGSQLAVGGHDGEVAIFDAQSNRKVRTFTGHGSRVGTMSWGSSLLATGSRDRSILLRDLRSSSQCVGKIEQHHQEVCGLEWSPDDQFLASGGNDNKLYVWGHDYEHPVHCFNKHKAAVKAIAWSPHQHGLLASGGGTADQRIRFWNTLTGQPLRSVDTQSQVCNLAWAKNANELVSTHGYSQNQICVWKYPTMTPLATLTGHSYRVLYLAMSPDGQTIVTGAGDETLRFWNVFNKARSGKGAKSVLNLFSQIR